MNGLASQLVRSSLVVSVTVLVAACGAATDGDNSPTGPKTPSITGTPGMPEGWSGAAGSHNVGLTTKEKHGGAAAL